jgi:hypothetical protein
MQPDTNSSPLSPAGADSSTAPETALDSEALGEAAGGGIIQWIKDLFTDDGGDCGGGGGFGGGGASGSW